MSVQFTTDQYKFLVEQLACGETNESTALAYMQEFPGQKIDPRAVKGFARDKLPGDWQAYFDACRTAFKAGAAAAAIDRDFMLALLDKWLRAAGARGAHDVALKYAELIEKIRAGYFGGKAAPGGAASNAPNAQPVTEIRRIVVYPPEVAPDEKAKSDA